LDAVVAPTEAAYTHRIERIAMRFAGERRRGERGEEDEKTGQGEIIACLYLWQIAMV
jgi:hypothetical protein